MNSEDEIVYLINTDDLMVVANETIGRDLKDHEVDYLKNSIGNYINWYDVIEVAIKEMLIELAKRN